MYPGTAWKRAATEVILATGGMAVTFPEERVPRAQTHHFPRVFTLLRAFILQEPVSDKGLQLRASPQSAINYSWAQTPPSLAGQSGPPPHALPQLSHTATEALVGTVEA